ncbi:MAG TPA: 2-oxo-4-hydroxy-4-carboxy-5-ureidoimidazoline decarboxylase, partial [Candidatus Dormibacteraeota bacterium]
SGRDADMAGRIDSRGSDPSPITDPDTSTGDTASGMGLERLNRLPAAAAEAELHDCCGSGRWAAAVAAGRPYPTPAALHAAAERAWWALDEAGWQEAFAAHPRIGERAGAVSRREQQALDGASAETLAALAEGNRRYEERFGRIFLVCATGRTASEMLAQLRQRLGNDPETELRVAAGEQARITRLRLERLLA